MHMIEIWGHKLVRMITLLSHSAPTDNETVLRLRNPRKRLIVHHIVPLSTEQWFTTRAIINTSNLTVPNPISRSCSTKSAILRLSLPCLNGRISFVTLLLSSLTRRNTRRYSSGAREYTTNLYDPTQAYPRGLIGPANFIWQPLPLTTPQKGQPLPDRRVLIRVHPTIARQAVAAFGDAFKRGSKVAIRKYEEEFVTFEVTGRRAVEVIKAVVRPIKSSNKEVKEVSLPSGSPWGYSCTDRIRSR